MSTIVVAMVVAGFLYLIVKIVTRESDAPSSKTQRNEAQSTSTATAQQSSQSANRSQQTSRTAQRVAQPHNVRMVQSGAVKPRPRQANKRKYNLPSAY